MEHGDYTVGWIFALLTELAAAAGVLDKRYNPLPQDSHDYENYTLGRIGVHNVAIACLLSGATGTTSAAVVASRMRSTFPSIRFGLMVGLGDGAPSAKNDIRSGRRDDQQIGWDVWRGDPVRLSKDIYKNISRLEVPLACPRIETHL